MSDYQIPQTPKCEMFDQQDFPCSDAHMDNPRVALPCCLTSFCNKYQFLSQWPFSVNT